MKKLKSTVRAILYITVVAILASCTRAGTLERIDKGNNEQIEVFKYYYNTGDYVYVARFKDTPNIVSTTWRQRNGKVTSVKGNVVIFENDTIQVILKN